MLVRAIRKTGPRRCGLLYVEEHAESVALVEQLLAGRKDLLLLRAADLSLGIKLARSKRPEVILINIDLPGLEAGFFHYLTRPIQAGPLMEALDYALEFAALERAEQL